MKERIRRERTGCKSCKIRKVKCDEARPTCTACDRLELECVYEVTKEQLLAARGLKKRQNSVGRDSICSDETIELSREESPACKTVAISIKEAILPETASIVPHLKLFHHFTTTVINEMKGRPSNKHTDLIWQQDIPAAAFDNEYVIHALLSIAARDLEFKHRRNVPQRTAMRVQGIQHEAKALSSLTKALQHNAPATLQMLLAVLMLTWTCILTNEDVAAQKHHIGAQSILSRLPSDTLNTALGRELLTLFTMLDLQMVNTNFALPQSRFGICHELPQLQCLTLTDQDALTQEIRAIQTARYEVMKFSTTFLESHVQPLSTDQQEYAQNVLRQTCRWYIKALTYPEYAEQVVPESSHTLRHPFGSITYPSAAAAVNMTQFYRVLHGLYRTVESRNSFDPTPFRYNIATRVRQMLAGAIDSAPSLYSRELFSDAGVYAPVCATNDIVLDEELRQYQLEAYEFIEKLADMSVWNMSHPDFQNWSNFQQATDFKMFKEPYQRWSNAVCRSGLTEDWENAHSHLEPSDFNQPGGSFGSYTQYIDANRVMKVIVIETRISLDGIQTFKFDHALTEHWTKLAEKVNFWQKYKGDAPNGTFARILREEGLGHFLDGPCQFVYSW